MNNIENKKDIIAEYIKAELFSDNEEIREIINNGNKKFLFDALMASGNCDEYGNREYLEDHWYYPRDSSLFEDLLSKIGIQIKTDETESVKGSIALHQHNVMECDGAYKFTYDNKDYHFFIYQGEYEVIYYVTALANVFLSKIEHPKRFYKIGDIDKDESTIIVNMNYEIAENIDSNLKLPCELVTWDEYGYTPFFIPDLKKVIGEEYSDIINNEGFYIDS